MTSIFQKARQGTQEQPEETPKVFKFLKEHRKQNIIPPVGIAKPELVESFINNMDDEQKILQAIKETEEYERETPLKTGTREVLGHGARALEGFFGGISSFMNAITPELSENEEGMPYGPGEAPRGLPTAHDLREFTKEKTGNYLEPKTQSAKATQEAASDIGSMFSTPGLSAIQKILTPIGGQITKQMIKSGGGSETAQDIGKIGFSLISTIAQLGDAPRAASRALTQAEQMIPQGVRFSAAPAENVLNRIRNSNWFSSGATPSKNPAMREIERIQSQIQNGTIDAHMTMQLRRDINEARKELGAFKFNQVADRAQARRYLSEVDQALIDTMENYGRNVNPEWFRNYTLANESYRVTQNSRDLADFISKNAKPLKSDIAKTLYHIAGTSGALNLPLLAGAAGGVTLAVKGIQTINRMIRSPVLRNHYIQVLSQAAKGNAAATQKALEKFDIVAKSLEDKDKKKSLKTQFQVREE